MIPESKYLSLVLSPHMVKAYCNLMHKVHFTNSKSQKFKALVHSVCAYVCRYRNQLFFILLQIQ